MPETGGRYVVDPKSGKTRLDEEPTRSAEEAATPAPDEPALTVPPAAPPQTVPLDKGS